MASDRASAGEETLPEELTLSRVLLDLLDKSAILEASAHNMFDGFQHAFNLPIIDRAERF